ncbi:MAG: hypothetical protein IIB41_02685 [Candidatus Marinimicrobia bacterium]|nr:hypothetical protein [Candidatus Neomarinimicrobiota bacterium]
MIIVVEVNYFQLENDKPDHIAFLCTVTDQFIKFDGTHVWDSWAEFETYADKEFLDRVRGLCPQWFFKKQ